MNEFEPVIERTPGLTYVPEHHELIEPPGEYVEGLRSISGKPGFMLYRHREHGTFVVGYWWQHPDEGKGVICELFALADHPNALPPHIDVGMPPLRSDCRYEALPDPHYICECCVGPVHKRYNELMAELRGMIDDKASEEKANREEIRDIGDHLARRGKIKNQDHPAIKMLQRGELPMMASPEDN